MAKGQGRAILHLRSVDPAPYFHSVRRAVLRWQGYDAQCEPKRGEYLVDLINASSEPEQLKELVIRHLARQEGYWGHRAHKRDAVRVLALRGSEAAKQALYRAFESGDVSADDAILELEGLVGLEWLLLNSLKNSEIDRSQREWWVRDLAESLGEDVVRVHLLSSDEVAVRDAAEYMERTFENRPWQPHKSGFADFDDLKHQWQEKKSRVGLWKWGMEASGEELAKAALEFETCEDAEFLRALAKIFEKVKKYPGSYPTVARRAKAWPADDQPNPFTLMLSKRKAPSLRKFGLTFLAEGRIPEGIDLIRKNALPVDGPAIIEGLGRVPLDDLWFVHGIGLDCFELAKLLDNLHAGWIFGWMFEHSPCSFCRNSAFRDMTDRGLATPAMVAEAMWDCDPDTRQVARSVSLIDPLPTDPFV